LSIILVSIRCQIKEAEGENVFGLFCAGIKPVALILGKTVSRKAGQDRNGKTTSCQALAFHPIGLGFYLYKYLNFFAPLASMRENWVVI
jgi:hypothetical protein